MTAAIACSGISKAYRIYDSPGQLLRELLTFRRHIYHREFHALRNVCFEIQRGESVALLGENGSGKSTLLQIVAGILTPTSGDLQVNGRIAALLELGSGFNPEFTGRENVLLGASLLGTPGSEIEQVYRRAVEFADIGDFINQPVRTYSSGMAVRLSFAVAIHCKPEILLVDEALSVGDLGFRQQCLQRIDELRRSGVTLILVSHSAAEAKQFCERALWLDAGTLRQAGPSDRVVDEYLATMAEKDARYALRHRGAEKTGMTDDAPDPKAAPMFEIPESHRTGSGAGRITGLALLNDKQCPVSHMEAFRPVNLVVRIQAVRDLQEPVVGFIVRNHLGMTFSGSDTALEACDLPSLHAGDGISVSFRITPPEFYAANLSFSVYLNEGPGELCDLVENAMSIQMLSMGRPVYGYLHVPCGVEVYRNHAENRQNSELSAVDVA